MFETCKRADNTFFLISIINLSTAAIKQRPSKKSDSADSHNEMNALIKMAVINHGFGFGMLTRPLSSPLIDMKRLHKSAAVSMLLLLCFFRSTDTFSPGSRWAVVYVCSSHDVESFLVLKTLKCTHGFIFSAKKPHCYHSVPFRTSWLYRV